MLNEVAGVLGLREVHGQQLLDVTQEYLAARDLLIVLDNFEHLLEAAPLVLQLLVAGPRVTTLVTSREPLRLRGEREYPVPTFPLPSRKDMHDPTQLQTNEAVAFFVDRAQAVRPDFTLSAQNAPAVVEICHRLDGLPLALELVAARIKILPPSALVARLDARLSLLTSSARDAPERQRSLRDAMAWSHDLLHPEEARLFRRLGVFVGGWTLEAAEAVANPDGTLDALSGMASLVDKSLVRVEEDHVDARYAMFETIREFALDRLVESGEQPTLRSAHAAFFLLLAEAAEPQLTRAAQREWLDRLDADRPNITAALGWFLKKGQVEEGLRLAAALRQFWAQRGPFAEASRWLAAFLQEPAAESVPHIRGRALEAAGFFAHWEGHYEQSLAYWQEALALFQKGGDAIGEAQVLRDMGSIAIDLGDRDHAQDLLGQSLAHRGTGWRPARRGRCNQATWGRFGLIWRLCAGWRLFCRGLQSLSSAR